MLGSVIACYDRLMNTAPGLLQCIERNVNHYMNMHYVDASCEHALWSRNKRVLQPLLYFENCRVNPLQSNLNVNDHVMKT